MANKECIFCLDNELISPQIIVENEMAFAMWDNYPVTPGHALIIPRQHRNDYFEVTSEELQAIHTLGRQTRDVIDKSYSPEGYNIFTNIAKAAGQVVMHAHLHMVPRFMDDQLVLRLGDHDAPDRAE